MFEESANPSTTHAEYDHWLPTWKRCRDFVAGERAVKDAGGLYLPPVSEVMTPARYAHYLSHADFEPAASRTVEACTGLLFRQPLGVVAPPALAAHLTDVTLQGETLLAFAQLAAIETLTVGGFVALLDVGQRPYWTGYRREQVVNYRTAVAGGDTALTMLVLCESYAEPDPSNRFKARPRKRYRVLELVGGTYSVTVWEQNPDTRNGGAEWVARDPIVPTRRGTPLDFIPVVFFSPLGGLSDPTPGKPPVLDLVNVNLAHYRKSADYGQALHWAGMPQPYVTGHSATEPLMIGGGKIWTFDGPETKVGLLESRADSVGALRIALQDLRLLMQALGARLIAEPEGAETATAAKIRNAAETAALRNVAIAVSEGCTALARWHHWWNGFETPEDEIAVTVSTDLAASRLTSDEVRALLEAVEKEVISWESAYSILQRGEWALPGISAEIERARISAGAA